MKMSETRNLCNSLQKRSRKRQRDSNRMTPSTLASSKPERSMLNDSLCGLYKIDSGDHESTGALKNEASENKINNKEENCKTPSSSRAKRSRTAAPTPTHSTVTFADVGGMDNTIRSLYKMFLHFKIPLMYRKHIKPKRGILLHGPPGCGKTYLAQALAGSMKIPILEIASTELVSGISGDSEKKIRETFDAAVACGRCILFIDEIEAICPKREDTNNEMMRRMVSQLIKSFDALSVKDPAGNVMVIGATNMPDMIDPALRRGSRFDLELAIGIPNEDARLKILKVLLEPYDLSQDFNFDWLAHNTPGYVGVDLQSLVTQAAVMSASRCCDELLEFAYKKDFDSLPIAEMMPWFTRVETPNEKAKGLVLTMDDFKAALRIFVPSSKREGFASIPDSSLDDVGALENVKEELRNSLLLPVKYSKYYKENNLSCLKGILLFGPKGCGKTILAKAIANECGINFLLVSGPELMSMYVGESEKAVRRCFQRARNSAPCVIFFDEFDALCPARSHSGKENSVMDRVVNQLLTEADGMVDRQEVFMIAATNRIEEIDPAMLRPGRFDKCLYVGVPTPADRVAILKSKTKNKTRPKIEDDLELEKIGLDDRCTGFSGADLTYTIRIAEGLAFREILRMDPNLTSSVVLCWRHFDEALNTVKPSISKEDQDYFERAALNYSSYK